MYTARNVLGKLLPTNFFCKVGFGGTVEGSFDKYWILPERVINAGLYDSAKRVPVKQMTWQRFFPSS
jgi:hypothetical protein